MGVADGSVITVRVKGEKKKKAAEAKAAAAKAASASRAASPAFSANKAPSTPGGFAGLDDLLKASGMSGGGGADSGLGDLQALMSSMGGMDKPPSSPKEALQMMKKLLSSPLVSSFISDPTKLEMARQAVLNNPMIKAMLTSSLPGFDTILNDKDTWAMTLVQAKEMYLNMGEAEMEMMAGMMKAQGMGGNGGIGGMGGMGSSAGGMSAGMFDGMDLSNVGGDNAVDELDEDE
jgi:hypothetical protein